MDAAELFRANLPLIDRAIAGVCRRRGVYGADADDFASSVRLALIDNDYAALRKHEGRSSLATYITVIAEHLLYDQQRSVSRWRPSAEAERCGEAGILLERLLVRDGRSLEEALPLVRDVAPMLTPQDIATMAARLPSRTPRPRAVELDVVSDVLAARDRADDRLLASHARSASGLASRVIRNALDSWPAEDAAIVRMRFGSGMPISDISRMLRLPQRPLYRRVEALLARLRRELEQAGIDDGSLEDLIGDAGEDLDFGFAEWKSDAHRPVESMDGDEAAKES